MEERYIYKLIKTNILSNFLDGDWLYSFVRIETDPQLFSQSHASKMTNSDDYYITIHYPDINIVMSFIRQKSLVKCDCQLDHKRYWEDVGLQ